MYSPTEEFMQRALLEGKKALPSCIPNPPVGCVLVRHGEVIATGFTQPPGQCHAEAMALAQVDGDLSDVTAFVTLEPCSFHGRTPSCAKTLVERGVKCVVVAMLDPDPRNSGAGIEILKAAGINVKIGVLEDKARDDLGRYLALPANKLIEGDHPKVALAATFRGRGIAAIGDTKRAGGGSTAETVVAELEAKLSAARRSKS
nr:bifunctional diaminohydroxyphosphoribosylaminopyrimidine deaminase/5-amino-6-(5-phosphoribosylamino)uracil reductase RibD [uncultured Rhodoferax sp.]